MHRARGFALTIAATVIVTLGIAIVPLVLIARPTDVEEATKMRGIKVRTQELAMVPDNLAKSRRDQIAKDLEIFLDLFYTEAFVPAPATSKPSPAAIGSRIERLPLVAASRKELREDPEVFDLGPNLAVTTGDLGYRGVVTTHQGNPVEAILEIELEARASLTEEDVDVATITQKGTLVLTMAGDGWRLRAFDLELGSRPLSTPTPR